MDLVRDGTTSVEHQEICTHGMLLTCASPVLVRMTTFRARMALYGSGDGRGLLPF